MKHIYLYLLLCHTLLAAPGEEIFDQYCLSCHIKTPTEFEAFKKEKDFYKAPPMNLVISRLKDVINISLGDEDAKKAVITAFIRDYVLEPSIDKGLCRIECFVQFGEMPKLPKPPSDNELKLVSDWVYDHY